jgi:hypothetical protein
MPTPTPESVSARLTQHQRRREQGTPTISVLIGPLGVGLRAWRDWARQSGRLAVHAAVPDPSDPSEALVEWLAASLGRDDRVDLVAAWLAGLLHRPATALAAELAGATHYDLGLLRSRLPVAYSDPAVVAAFTVLANRDAGAVTLARRVLHALAVGQPTDPTESARRVARAVLALCPPARVPALLITPPAPPDPAANGWLKRALATLERISNEQPRLALALAVPRDWCDALLAQYPNSHAATYLREGRIDLPAVEQAELVQRLQSAGVSPLPSPESLRQLLAHGLPPDTADLLVETAKSLTVAPDASRPPGDFRSRAEQLVYELLEINPATAGLFKPNCPLDFKHGHQPAEADFLAESLRLVLEIDGAYYHLRPDQFCRDRHKDRLYQEHGYFVLRFLDTQVVQQWDQVLQTIHEVIQHRQRHRA